MIYRILHRGTATALMLAPLAACGSPPVDTAHDRSAAIDGTAVTDEVWANVTVIVTAFNADNAEKAVSFNAPDFIQMFHGQSNANNAANLASTRKQLADPEAKLTVSGEMVDVSKAGDMAVYTALYAYEFTDPATDAVVTERGNWVMIFRRQLDGSMKIYREIISDMPPASANDAGSTQ